VVDRRWAIDWEAALAPPLAMIPDLSAFVSPMFDSPVGADLSRPLTRTMLMEADLSRPGAINCAATPEWENALEAALGSVEEEEAAAFQRDSLHL
jgi:hypothetical protein